MNPAQPCAAVPITEALGRLARSHPATAATIVPAPTLPFFSQRYRTATFASLHERSDALAAGFSTLGVTAGVKVAVLVPPTEDFFALAFALLKAGAIPVLIDPGIGLAHLKVCLAEAAPSAFVGVPKAHLARRLFGWCPTATIRVSVGGGFLGTGLAGGLSLRSIEERGRMALAARTWTPPSIDADALAAVVFTSGSTGTPKGVEYQHRQLAAQVEMLRALYDIEPGLTNLATFPPFALFGPSLGMTTVIPKMDPTRPAKVDPRRVLDAAHKFGATMMFGSPALLDTVSRWGERTGKTLGAIRRVLSAGAPVPPRVMRRMLAMLPAGAEIFTPYGATEALPVCNIGSREVLELTDERTGICVGRPANGIDVTLIRISDAPIESLCDADMVAPGRVGEIVVRGPNVTRAYHLRDAATQLAKTLWEGRIAHRMGDLGWFDSDGRLWFAGRKVHRVETPEGTMFSVPVEEVFNAHPSVFRSALVGVPKGETCEPVLCVELERDARPSAALSSEILALGGKDPERTGADRVQRVLYHSGFPVDIRHNSKINREALARWASVR